MPALPASPSRSRARRRALALAAVLVAAPGCGSKTGLPLPVLESSGLDDQAPSQDAGDEEPTRPERPPRPRAEKIDLLFMIDNSGSMGDKQAILSRAIPDVVARLSNPLCVGIDGTPLTTQPLRGQRCPEGSFREFDSVQDMHIGVISSSLGGHGNPNGCGFGFMGRANDKGHLLDRGAPGQTYEDLGFVAWDPAGTKEPPGEDNPDTLRLRMRKLVEGVGESGCGIEASLEAWYRFLIDPTPHDTLPLEPCPDGPGDCATPRGIDDVVLRQRADFLRPDSLLAIVMLTDENDCSIVDGGRSWKVLDQGGMPRATAVCATDPYDPCCQSCGDPRVSPACPEPALDPECARGPYTPEDDSFLLRCFDQKRRFGKDFRYPVERYIAALTEESVVDRDGQRVPNPLFAPDERGLRRDPSLVYLAGITGVPWQDVARDPSPDAPLVYKAAKEMHADGTWDLIVGDPDRGILPLDPLMIESISEREGVHPPTGFALAPSSSLDARANPINGHEMSLGTAGFDLQYACVFDLEVPRSCAGAFQFCDCDPQFAQGQNKPICQDETGSYGSTQYRAKAYPGLRQLQVLRGIGDNAIVASICARNVGTVTAEDFGYRPALRALLDRLGEGLL